MSKLAAISFRLIPVLMQIFGLAGMAFGGWYSVVIIFGSGIGNPDGITPESIYTTAGWLVGVPALVFLIGWVWVIAGYLSGPRRPRRSIPSDSLNKQEAEQAAP